MGGSSPYDGGPHLGRGRGNRLNGEVCVHIRLSRGRFDPARYDELLQMTEQTIEAARQVPGCRSFQIAIDRQAGRVIALSTWNDPDQAPAISQLRARAEAIGVQFEAPEMYEVVAQT